MPSVALAVQRFDQRGARAGDDDLAELGRRRVAPEASQCEWRRERAESEPESDEASDETHDDFPLKLPGRRIVCEGNMKDKKLSYAFD